MFWQCTFVHDDSHLSPWKYHVHNHFCHSHMCYSFGPTICFCKKHKCFLHHHSPLLHIIATLLCLELLHSNCFHCVHSPSIVLKICSLHWRSYVMLHNVVFLHQKGYVALSPLLPTLVGHYTYILAFRALTFQSFSLCAFSICYYHNLLLAFDHFVWCCTMVCLCAKRVPLCLPHCQGRFFMYSFFFFCFSFLSCVSTLNCVLYVCFCIPLLFFLR